MEGFGTVEVAILPQEEGIAFVAVPVAKENKAIASLRLTEGYRNYCNFWKNMRSYVSTVLSAMKSAVQSTVAPGAMAEDTMHVDLT